MPGEQKPRNKLRRRKSGPLGVWTLLAVLLLIALYGGALELSKPHVEGRQLRYDTLILLAGRGQLKSARVLDQDAYVVGRYLADDGSESPYNSPLLAGTQGVLLQQMVDSRVPTTVDQQVGKRVASLATVLLPGLILVVLFGYLILSYRRGTGLFGIRSGARRSGAGEGRVTFADVAAQGAAITELREVVQYLADPEPFAAVGAVVPKSILLFGPPGCGKTLLAQAVASEAGAAFYSISGSDFVEMYVGVGAARVRDLFKEARENAPSIVFIDELDSVGRRRRSGMAGGGGSSEEQEQALNQILAELDGFSPLEGVVVIGATNRPDVLDPALLRPGRFDRTIALERPDEAGRLAILRLHAQKRPLEPNVDLDGVASQAVGLTGADLAAVVNGAALLAVRAGRTVLSQEDLEASLQRILGAPELQRRLSMRDRGFARSANGRQRVTFDDVAGLDEAVEELAEVKAYLLQPERFAAVGARPPRGFLLAGPPGTGKTLLARALAGEAHAAFFSVAASEFVEVFAGEGAARVRDLFAEARATAPAIVFLDEIDAVGGRREAGSPGAGEREQTLNQILVELDGFDSSAGVTVLAATNRPEILDEALLRPGRFDRFVTVSLPDRAGRRAILALHSGETTLASDVDLDVVAALTGGLAGADLANLVNEAAILAARRNTDEVTMALLEEALDRAFLGVGNRPRVLSKDERLRVAYHEIGHVIVGRALAGAPDPHKVTILGAGRALGASWTLDQGDWAVRSREELVDLMAGLLAGRAAEDLVLGDAGTTSADDVRRAGALARQMIFDLGMGQRSALFPFFSGATGVNGGRYGCSEETARQADEELRLLMEEAFDRARSVLSASRALLDRTAVALLERETLSAGELDQLVTLHP